ncbi:MAG TPA: amidohydrolase family protein [Steroidobacteraceae bacterium]|jgi:predicted amidohydrolase YtcJ|nr:amidohydrolase family protein [Steroidobacteraceae bacterium]
MHKLELRLAVIAWSLSAVPFAAGVAAEAHAPADLVLTDAKIYTADAGRSMAEALAVTAGKIVFVGSKAGAESWIGPNTRVERQAGRLILPGLFDSHIHPLGIVDLDVCDLKSQAKSLKEMTAFVQGCIKRYRVPAGEWLSVRQWNFSNGNEPDAEHPTLRAALDLASTAHPIQLLGNDGHHGAFNSAALARATNADGKSIGYSKATLAAEFKEYRKLVGVDAGGEPNGTVNEHARRLMGTPSMRMVDFPELMKDPARITARLNSVGITGIMDAAVPPETLPLYDTLEKTGKLTVRATLAQFYDPDVIKTPGGQPDWARMVSTATSIRSKYAKDPLIRADIVKLFADGVLEGNPYAMPPTLPEVAAIKPYLQPIFAAGKDGHLSVAGYVDTASSLCVEVRAHREAYESASAAAAFLKQHGYHPGQCQISSGELQHERAVILEFVKRFHLAGFGVHIHAIGDAPIRTAVDAIESARAADGNSSTHDGLAHVQLVNPDDVARIGRDHLYLAFTYSWVSTDPEYDLSVVPFFDKVRGGDTAALHPADGYYEKNAYPVRALKDAGAILVAGSDAPVETRDPRPFVNMAMAVTRRVPGSPALNASQAVPIRDAIDAYTINGAQYLKRDKEAGSIEAGKSADFIVLDRDILQLADTGAADDIAKVQVLETYFMGSAVYRRPTPQQSAPR